HGQARKHRIIDYCQGLTCFYTSELLYERLSRGTHQVVASLAVLLAGDVHPAYHGKPPGALVQLSCHALAGLADTNCDGKGSMTPLPHQPGDLSFELQDDHALWRSEEHTSELQSLTNL